MSFSNTITEWFINIKVTSFIFIFSTVERIKGGCYRISEDEFYNPGADSEEEYLPVDDGVTSYKFETCDGSSCFALSPPGKVVRVEVHSLTPVTCQYNVKLSNRANQ